MWKKAKEYMSSIILILAFLGAAAGGVTYFAKASDLEALASSYQFDKNTQRHNAIQERIWKLEEDCKNGCSQAVKEEIKKLKLELKELDRKLKK
jgi:uncharacterized protein YdcH (DUF465 family)